MKHGSRASYMNRGCRCDECRAAATAYNRHYRATQLNDFGRRKRQLTRRKQDYRNRRAAAYVREHLPDIWADIAREAESLRLSTKGLTP